MVDLNQAFQDAKGLPDDRLQQELAKPSGLIPGYILMSEAQDRKAMRGSGAHAKANRPSMKDELLASLPRPEPFTQPLQVPQSPMNSVSMQGRMGSPMLPALPIDAPTSAPSRQYSRGGIIAGLNPFYAMAQGLQDPKIKGGLMQEAMNMQNGGYTSADQLEAPGAPAAADHTSSMIPTPSEKPQPLPRAFNNGGLASLYRR